MEIVETLDCVQMLVRVPGERVRFWKPFLTGPVIFDGYCGLNDVDRMPQIVGEGIIFPPVVGTGVIDDGSVVCEPAWSAVSFFHHQIDLRAESG